jgi:hypothetical protein
MVWEQRGNRRYYYRVRRDGDRVVKEYIGGGEKGREAAAADQAAREARTREQRLWRRRKRYVDELGARLHDVEQAVDLLVTCQLLTGGWHKHHRQWRKDRRCS